MALGSVSIHSCWASSKVYHSFIFIWWKNALSFVCLDIDISIHFVFKLIYVYDRSFGFFLSSWYPMWFETFYFILFLIRMVAFSVYIFLLYLLGWKSFFLWLFIFRTSKLRNDVYACFIYCGRSSLFSTRYGFDLTYTSYLVMVGDCS